jgi:hypothetical protein
MFFFDSKYFAEVEHWCKFKGTIRQDQHLLKVYKMKNSLPSVVLDQEYNSFVLTFCKTKAGQTISAHSESTFQKLSIS